jgi:selenoprotein W-related protein
LAERLLSDYTNRISELVLQPSSGGRFEVSVDGRLIFSKAQTGRFPTEEEIKKALG